MGDAQPRRHPASRVRVALFCYSALVRCCNERDLSVFADQVC